MAGREALLSRTFVELADTLVDEFDIIELLTLLTDRAVTILDAGAAGILLADAEGTLHVVAASSEQARVLELFQLQSHEGPCLDSVSTGRPVVNQDLATSARWPRFAEMALAAGFRSVQAFPLRLRERVIGGMNVFLDDRVALTDLDIGITQALADAATIAILQNQAVREAEVLAAQLQEALRSRIAIEQAKGVLAERAGVGTDEAFARLRTYARAHNRRLSELASALVEGALGPDEVDALASAGGDQAGG